MTERRPVSCAPIFDEADIPREGLEPLCLAYERIGGMPEPSGRNRLEVSGLEVVLVIFHDALGFSGGVKS